MEKVAGLPRGEASARATLRGAVVLLTAHLLGRGAARGGGGSRDSSSRNFLTDRPIPIGYPKNCSAQQLLAARLGDSFYFAKSEIVESLLRRGARGSLCILQQEPNKSPGGAVARGDFISIVLAHND